MRERKYLPAIAGTFWRTDDYLIIDAGLDYMQYKPTISDRDFDRVVVYLATKYGLEDLLPGEEEEHDHCL